MKQSIRLLMIFMLLSYISMAQNKPYNVVFDITSKDTSNQKAVIRWIKGIISSNSTAKLEVVLYGRSLDMVTQGKSIVSNDVKELAANKNIAFKVCAIAMKHHNIDDSQLLPGVGTVPDGIYEIITKQGEGWGYIKASD